MNIDRYRTITIVTPKGKHIAQTFRVNDMNDMSYIAGYVQACKDKGATILFEDNDITKAID